MPNYEITPSFKYKVREAIKESRFFRAKKWFDPIMSLDIKDVAYRFCEQNGILTPELYATNTKLENLSLPENVNNIVLKPLSSHSSFGVFLLKKTRENHFHNLIDNSEKDFSEILLEAKRIMDDKKFPNNWMLEELLEPLEGVSSVDDWKFYTFYGKCPLILQKHRTEEGKIEYQWYDQDWNVVTNTGRYRDAINKDLTPPKMAKELYELAINTSKLIPAKFMRIDLFETTKGPVLGEFTPFPGGFSMFYEYYNKLLGEYWLDSESRLHWDYKTGTAYEKINNIKKSLRCKV